MASRFPPAPRRPASFATTRATRASLTARGAAIQWNFGTSQIGSLFSADGVTFTPETGVRYTLQPADKGTLGVYDAFSDRQGGVVLLYLGDLPGLNNVRRAYSRDNGLTFTFDRGNILGDDNAGGGANSFVDEKSIRLPDGRIRLFTMRQHTIYSFVSVDDGYSFVRDPGTRLEPRTSRRPR